MAARTRHRCSCMGCGNPRRWSNGKWFGRTMQERRADDAARTEGSDWTRKTEPPSC
jgi:hypothetical protein